MKKSWYCPKCKTYPDTIIIIHSKPRKETYTWNGEYYQKILYDKSIDVTCCAKCCEVLERR